MSSRLHLRVRYLFISDSGIAKINTKNNHYFQNTEENKENLIFITDYAYVHKYKTYELICMTFTLKKMLHFIVPLLIQTCMIITNREITVYLNRMPID